MKTSHHTPLSYRQPQRGGASELFSSSFSGNRFAQSVLSSAEQAKGLAEKLALGAKALPDSVTTSGLRGFLQSPEAVLDLYQASFCMTAQHPPLSEEAARFLADVWRTSATYRLNEQAVDALRLFVDASRPQDPLDVGNRKEESLATSATPEHAYSEDDRTFIASALDFAFAWAQGGGVHPSRRDKGLSMFTHLCEVGLLLTATRQSAEVVVAGLLHDVFEGIPVGSDRLGIKEQVRQQFGDAVWKLITAVTEPTRGGPMGSFSDRKREVLRKAELSPDVATLLCASKLSTYEAGLSHLREFGTTSGWSTGSLEQNLAILQEYQATFARAGVPASLRACFNKVADGWKELYHSGGFASQEASAGRDLAPEQYSADELLRSRKITLVTGGQTGVDRAMLDAAIELGYSWDGWCPKGRLAADGVIDEKYKLREAPSADPAWRTSANARDSDVTIILSRGTPKDGTPLTAEAAEFFGTALLEVSLDQPLDRNAFVDFLNSHKAMRVNIAGPRQNTDVGDVYTPALEILRKWLAPKAGDEA